MAQAQIDRAGFFKKIDIYLDEEYLIRVEDGPSIGIFHTTQVGVRGIRLTPERWMKIKELIDSVDFAMSMVPKRAPSEERK